EKEERLIKLLSIPGTSGNEELVADQVLEMLGEITGTSSVVIDGNIQGELRKSTGKAILLSAHMDVYTDFSPDAEIVKRDNCLYRPGNILGADDRAGIALILDVLQFLSEIRNGYSIKYLFTTSEEHPPHGVESVDPAFFENVEFALSLDRKGCRDIVYKSGSIEYSSQEFAEKISQISRNLFGIKDAFSPCEGGISDLRFWSDLCVESVNLSIGYSDEHTPIESLDLCHWNRTYELVLRIIESEYELYTHRLFQQRMNKNKP
ncbi:MAG TPA: M28 family peptidase, partial [Anaerolineaceae bacterium]|nr:M28 family peptidase [Anaerolineaceae bacterium]